DPGALTGPGGGTPRSAPRMSIRAPASPRNWESEGRIARREGPDGARGTGGRRRSRSGACGAWAAEHAGEPVAHVLDQQGPGRVGVGLPHGVGDRPVLGEPGPRVRVGAPHGV